MLNCKLIRCNSTYILKMPKVYIYSMNLLSFEFELEMQYVIFSIFNTSTWQPIFGIRL